MSLDNLPPHLDKAQCALNDYPTTFIRVSEENKPMNRAREQLQRSYVERGSMMAPN
ncbi:hypothetical protein X777_11858 [Ooceraea biroi]|uniref:Uncharacterized protein n=1 Tax=Ooceraea biroi TaxID=2015173 RepID=A0A026W020_OOCBI|nr:hypothetical protein X777_11858 [Ooceraea biroi]